MKIIAERLKVLRCKAGKTQEEVGNAIGVNYTYIQKWEYATRTPGAEKLVQLADYFNTTTDYILGRTDKP